MEPQNSQPLITEQQRPKTGSSILLVNLGIFIAYFILFAILSGSHFLSDGLSLYFYCYLIHAVALVILSLFRLFQKKYSAAGIYFLTAIIIPIIGFGACTLGYSSGFLN